MKRAKPGVSTTTRRPPVPADSHAEIEAWLGRQMPDLQPIVRRLDELIREAIPDATYAIKWQKAYYGSPGLGWVIEMVAYDVSVNVVFLGGADYDDPPPSGTGRSRYVKLRSLEEAQDPMIRTWIGQAARVRGWN
jgi:hypothetical protein